MTSRWLEPGLVMSPANGAQVAAGTPLTVTGTAADTDGIVAGVQVSTDGHTWQPAVGYESFSYIFTPNTPGPLTIRSRAVDDSVNWEEPGAGVTITVGMICEESCELDYEACVQESGRPPAPTPAECQAELRACNARCRK